MLKKEHLEAIVKIDWEFEFDDTTFLTHNIHRYSSKYIPQIAGNLIKIFSKKGELILDNFVGSGTTLLEASILERRSIGVDINPLACLISKAKTTSIDESLLKKEIPNLIKKLQKVIFPTRNQLTLDFYNLDKKDLNSESNYELPNFPNLEHWFQKQVIIELALIKKYCNEIEQEDFRNLCLVCFSSIIRGASNASSEFGNLMVTKKPKKEIIDTLERFIRKLKKAEEEIIRLNKFTNRNKDIQIIYGDTRNLHFLSDETVDFIVTHPPYIAAVPYAEYQKLSLRWLDYSDRELDKTIIGGRRQSNYVVLRFNHDMIKTFKEMYRVLKSKKYCCVVIGNPTVKGELIKLNETFLDIGKSFGFKFLHQIIRGKYKTTMGKMKEEYILIFQKTQ